MRMMDWRLVPYSRANDATVSPSAKLSHDSIDRSLAKSSGSPKGFALRHGGGGGGRQVLSE